MRHQAGINPFKNGLIQAVYVIHARQFTVRAAHIKSELERFGIPFEFIETHDAATLTPEILRQHLAPESELLPAHVSCTLKHFEALRRIASDGHRLVLVLEDDVVLAENFCEELVKIAEEAGRLKPPYSIQLGCANNLYVPGRSRLPGKRLYEAGEVRATDAYLIGADAARLRLAWLEQNKIHLPTDHLFNLIDRQNKIRFFWSEPALTEQGSMNGLFSSELDARRKGRSLRYQKWKFWWQRLRRKYIYRFFR